MNLERVKYDIEKTQKRMHNAGLPLRLIERLERGAWENKADSSPADSLRRASGGTYDTEIYTRPVMGSSGSLKINSETSDVEIAACRHGQSLQKSCGRLAVIKRKQGLM